jgi:hypothetical protein
METPETSSPPSDVETNVSTGWHGPFANEELLEFVFVPVDEQPTKTSHKPNTKVRVLMYFT